MTCRDHRTPPTAKAQPRLPDGTVDVRALIAQLDAEANIGAAKGPGAMSRPEEVDGER